MMLRTIRKCRFKMEASMKCRLLALAVLMLASRSAALGDEPAGESCHLRELELCCVGATSIIQSPNGVPVTEAELKRQCEFLGESSQCFKGYGERCLTKSQFHLMEMLAGEVFEMQKELCTNGSRFREDYMERAPCLRKVQKKYQRDCIQDLQVGFENIHKLNQTMMFPTVCCNLNRLKECILPPIGEMCDAKALEMARNYLERAMGNVMGITCRNYDPSSEGCKGVLPKPGSKPNNGRQTSAISRSISSYTTIQ